MKNIRKLIVIFILFVYEQYIGDCEDDILNNFGKFFIKPAYYIQGLLIYLISIIFFPIVLIHIYLYNEIEHIIDMIYYMESI